MKSYNWGILGTGNIARRFVEGLLDVKGAVAYAVASRTEEKALEFANQHSVQVAYGSYADLVNDPLVDVIYIATPNNLHYDNTLMCLNAGKAVLCEKPFALNSTQLNEMVALAQSKKLFLMEALWTRFLPTIEKVIALIDSGIIGEPHLIKADFGFKAQYNPQSRLFDASLGGGSVLDIGIYPLFLSQLLFGKPTHVTSLSIKAPTGTDITTGMVLTHHKNRMSLLASSFAVSLETKAEIVGTDGTITLQRMFHMPTDITITKDGKTKKVPLKTKGNGYNYEADEVMKCLSEDKTESFKLPLSFSLELMETIDLIINGEL
jgi:predicted dehydrogenase